MFLGILALIAAIAISSTSGYMSVLGMGALFPAGGWVIIAMMSFLEGSKLITAAWVHHYWMSKLVTKMHKAYLVAAVVVLMMITSMGIYGYLAKAHLEQEAPVAGVQITLDAKQQQIDQLKASNEQLQIRLTQVNETINTFLRNDRASQGLRAQQGMAAERQQIQTKIDANNAEIVKITTEIAPIKAQISGVEVKLGPLKYVSQLFGWNDSESAVRLIILLLMFAFDPLAVVLMISATISLQEWKANRENKAPKVEMPLPLPDPEPVPEPGEPDCAIDPEVTQPEPVPEPEPIPEAAPEAVEDDIPWYLKEPHGSRLVAAAREAGDLSKETDLTDLSDEDFIRALTSTDYFRDLVEKKDHLDEYEPPLVEIKKPGMPAGVVEPSIFEKANLDPKAQLVSLLEANPELLDELISATEEARITQDEGPPDEEENLVHGPTPPPLSDDDILRGLQERSSRPWLE